MVQKSSTYKYYLLESQHYTLDFVLVRWNLNRDRVIIKAPLHTKLDHFVDLWGDAKEVREYLDNNSEDWNQNITNDG